VLIEEAMRQPISLLRRLDHEGIPQDDVNIQLELF
jgi:hypothetical protein